MEVSTKSRFEIGKKLSCFNLKIAINEKRYPLECAYQSSKVFSNLFGEYQVMEVLDMDPKSAKTRLAMEDHSTLTKFRFKNRDFSLEPKYLFYDWLYINAIKHIPNLMEELSQFKYFTDIEFNPEKSLNCQARTLVLYVWLIKNNKLENYLNNPDYFYKNIKSNGIHAKP